MKNKKKINLIHCPICSKEVKQSGLRNHILSRARYEKWLESTESEVEMNHFLYASENYKEVHKNKLII